jgi:hypothetical protein
MGVSVMVEWCVCHGNTERSADNLSAKDCPHVQVLPRLQKGKLLRAWMSLLQDQSLEIFCTERYGFPQLGVRTSRTIIGGISALTFLNAALHPSLFVDDLAEVGLEGVSIFDERRAINGKDTRLLFLGAGPARLINVSLDVNVLLKTFSMLVSLSPMFAGYPDRHG